MLRDGGPASMGGQAPNMAPNTNGGMAPAMNMGEGFDPKANKIVTIGASIPRWVCTEAGGRRSAGELGHRHHPRRNGRLVLSSGVGSR